MEQKSTSQLNDSQQQVITTDIKGAQVWRDDDARWMMMFT